VTVPVAAEGETVPVNVMLAPATGVVVDAASVVVGGGLAFERGEGSWKNEQQEQEAPEFHW